MADTDMAVTPEQTGTFPEAPAKTDPSDTPIPLWPEGVLLVVAGVTMLVIGLRHRTYIQRKVETVRGVVTEFQREGGVEEIQHLARQAAELLRKQGS